MNAALYLKKAVTIAMRYNLVRRQRTRAAKPPSAETGTPGLELQVIDYQHVHSLFPAFGARLRVSLHVGLHADVLHVREDEPRERRLLRASRAPRHVHGLKAYS